jgi:CRISPR-associated protein Cas1
MQPQANRPGTRGIHVAHGYGLKVHVYRDHLIVQDGAGRQRRRQRFHRATSGLKRLVVIGHSGYITFEALRWIHDVGAAFIQIDNDANLISTSALARHHESKLRRAQALAPESGLGRIALVQLLKAKLEAQATLVERLAHLRPTILAQKTRSVSPSQRIREHAGQLHPELDVSRLREIESSAGRVYWQTWARLPVNFDPALEKRVPDHWHHAGPRTSKAENKGRARKATSPVHAILNYSYAILEAEATIACHTMGLDPSLGLMHTDLRYRNSLATDVMEPARPAADALILDLLDGRVLKRGDIHETREGVCRLGPQLAHDIALNGSTLRAAVAPYAEQVAQTLSRSDGFPTPLTRSRHRAALAAR